MKVPNTTIPRGRRHNYKAFWNNQKLQEINEQSSTARDIMQTNPNEANIIEHNKQQASFRKEKINQSKFSWRGKTTASRHGKKTPQNCGA